MLQPSRQRKAMRKCVSMNPCEVLETESRSHSPFPGPPQLKMRAASAGLELESRVWRRRSAQNPISRPYALVTETTKSDSISMAVPRMVLGSAARSLKSCADSRTAKRSMKGMACASCMLRSVLHTMGKNCKKLANGAHKIVSKAGSRNAPPRLPGRESWGRMRGRGQ